MSRSYKHFPCVQYNRYGFKKIANHKVRRAKYIGNYSYYKKIFQSWEICDHKSIYFFYEYVTDSIVKLVTWNNQYTCRMSIRNYYKLYKWK